MIKLVLVILALATGDFGQASCALLFATALDYKMVEGTRVTFVGDQTNFPSQFLDDVLHAIENVNRIFLAPESTPKNLEIHLEEVAGALISIPQAQTISLPRRILSTGYADISGKYIESEKTQYEILDIFVHGYFKHIIYDLFSKRYEHFAEFVSAGTAYAELSIKLANAIEKVEPAWREDGKKETVRVRALKEKVFALQAKLDELNEKYLESGTDYNSLEEYLGDSAMYYEARVSLLQDLALVLFNKDLRVVSRLDFDETSGNADRELDRVLMRSFDSIMGADHWSLEVKHLNDIGEVEGFTFEIIRLAAVRSFLGKKLKDDPSIFEDPKPFFKVVARVVLDDIQRQEDYDQRLIEKSPNGEFEISKDENADYYKVQNRVLIEALEAELGN